MGCFSRLLQVVEIDPIFCCSRFSTRRLLAIKDFTFIFVSLLQDLSVGHPFTTGRSNPSRRRAVRSTLKEDFGGAKNEQWPFGSSIGGLTPDYIKGVTRLPAGDPVGVASPDETGRIARKRNDRRISTKKFRGVPSVPDFEGQPAARPNSATGSVGYKIDNIYRRNGPLDIPTPREKAIIAQSRISTPDLYRRKYMENPHIHITNNGPTNYYNPTYDERIYRFLKKINYASIIQLENPLGIFKLQFEENIITLQLARNLKSKDYMRKKSKSFFIHAS